VAEEQVGEGEGAGAHAVGDEEDEVSGVSRPDDLGLAGRVGGAGQAECGGGGDARAEEIASGDSAAGGGVRLAWAVGHARV
jgi:hypothetical protein